MRKQHIFRPNGWDGLEVRITPSAVGLAPAAESVRIDAHVRRARAHPHPVAHHKVHHPAPPPVHHVTHQGGGTTGGGTTGGGSYGGGYY
jgi:nicotinamidase-related amidase